MYTALRFWEADDEILKRVVQRVLVGKKRLTSFQGWLLPLVCRDCVDFHNFNPGFLSVGSIVE